MVIEAPAYSVRGGTEYIVADKVTRFYAIDFNGRRGTEVLLTNGQCVQLGLSPSDFNNLLQQARANSTTSQEEN